MSVVDASYDNPMILEEGATAPLAGGILQYGYQCGMLWGAALAAGARAYELCGPGPQAETSALAASQRLVESFRAHNKYINCEEITEVDWKPSSQRDMMAQVFKFFLKGGPIGCFRMAASYAPQAFNTIDATFSGEKIQAPAPPVSCTAALAQKMCLSDMHTVMTAGFAGGIGLSGGACGLLGTAVWVMGMKRVKEGGSKMEFKDPRDEALVEKFLESTDYEFECSEIVGRKFEDIGDHAAYLRAGGCSSVIEAMAAL
jgi:hypothetical protein